MKKYFFGFFILFTFFGCEQNPLGLPADTAPKIVLYGFISPQGAKLNVSQSAPSGQDLSLDEVYLNNAVPVFLNESGEILDTLRSIDAKGNYLFSKQVDVQANMTYKVKVFCDGFETAETIIKIPKPMASSIVATITNNTSYVVSFSLDFDYYQGMYYLFQVDGYDGGGEKRFVSGANNIDNEGSACPFNWALPLFFAHSSCLNSSSPTLSTTIGKRTTNNSTGEYIDLKKVKYRISVVDEKYKSVFERIDDLLLGYVEPILTEEFVQGGYGFIVPYNANMVDIYF